MQRLLGTLTIILISSVVAFSQAGDDHNDLLPVQTGYAVVTPVSGSGMVVFETFGLRRTAETTQAAVLPNALTTNAIVFVSSSGRLARNLGVAIANPNSASVNITLTLRRADGTQVATRTFALPGLQQTANFITELFTGSAEVAGDFMGTMNITSTAGVAIVGLRFRSSVTGANFSTIPVTSLSAPVAVPTISTNPLIGGAAAVVLPQFAANGGWATQIVIANTSSASLTVRVDLYKQDGTALRTALNRVTDSAFTNIVIPAGGVVSLAPRNTAGDDDF
jgi:hypothetical protein